MNRLRVLTFSVALALFACADPPAPAVPGAPTGVTVSFGDGSVTVQWKAPASDGGSPITGYTVVSAPGEATAKVDAQTLSAQLTGLTNGANYTFQVFATNAVGDGPLSLAAAPVAPGTAPDAPTAVSAVRGNAQATVSWTAPASDGGSDLTGYTITASPGDVSVTAPGYATSAVVPGLANGTAYTFTVVASNAHGDSAASAASAAVTPATVPDAVTEVVAVRGNTQATVTWLAPASNGGAALAGYRITSIPEGAAVTVDADMLTATVEGLTNGLPVTLQVVAFNEVGDSQPSTSNEIVPATVPAAPASAEAVRGDRQVSLSWTAPVANGGSVVTGYMVTGSPGELSLTTETLSATFEDLDNGTTYVFSIAAINDVGTGAGIDTAAVTPAAVPDAPGEVSAIAGDASVLVSWQAPADNGSALTGYVVTSTPAGFGATVDADSLSVAIDGLSNGAAYVFHVVASNDVGTGPEGTSASVTPLGPPDASTSTLMASSRTATADGAEAITLTFTVRDAQGNALSDVGVSFSTASDDLTFTARDGVTDAQGILTTEVMGARWGRYRVTATSGGVERHVDLEFLQPVCEGPLLRGAVPAIPVTFMGQKAVTGDLDGNGVGDVVFFDAYTPRFAVVLNASQDDYSGHIALELSRSAQSLAILDFDRDGHQDVVLGLSGTPSELAVFRGAGDGTLAPVRYVPVPMPPEALARHPGTEALLVADSSQLSVVELDEDGDVTSTSYAEGTGGVALSVADIDGDGHQDVVVMRNESPLLLYGVADGAFDENGIEFPSTSESPRVAFGDFNGDGLLDVAWWQLDDKLYVRFNEGDRTFSDPTSITLPHHPSLLVAYDHDGNGADELLAASPSNFDATVVKANDGALEDLERLTLGAQPVALLAQPIGDQTVPLALFPDQLRFPFAAYSAEPGEYLSIATGMAMATGDLDGDGLLDVVVTNSVSSQLVVMPGEAGRLLGAPVTYPGAGPSLAPVVRDLNGDDLPDVLVPRLAELASTLDLWLNQGDGSLALARQTPVCRNPYAMELGDLNADGHVDVVLACVGNTSTYADSGVMTLLGDGEGNFAAQPLLRAGMAIAGITLGDFNGDGHLDAASTALYSMVAGILLGDGSGRLSLDRLLLLDGNPWGVSAGDLDGDGLLDLAVGLPVANRIVTFRGLGDGRFEQGASTFAAGAGRPLIVDFDRDGHPEVLASSFNSPWLHHWRGVGQPESSIVSYPTSGPGFLNVADVDQDGRLDLLMGGVMFQSSCE